MSNSAHHDEPYDIGTRTKLLIYEKYLQAWLQVFLNTGYAIGQPLQFYDFFCGPGTDSLGTHGSPLILMEELMRNKRTIEQRGHNVRIVFNDADKAKITKLLEKCCERGYPWEPVYSCEQFEDIFGAEINGIGRGPSLVFIDQFGVKCVTEDVFKKLTNCKQTDILFFIASDYKRRFGDLLAPELSILERELKTCPHHKVHRLIADHYRKLAPEGYWVGHFSIKKGINIYGLIFGSNHWRGMQKFVEVAWKLDEEAGEANFDIESEQKQGEMDFETGEHGFKESKLEQFKRELREGILSKKLQTDGNVYLHCLINGILPSRAAKEVYKELKADGLLHYGKNDQPRFSSDSVKEPRNLQLK